MTAHLLALLAGALMVPPLLLWWGHGYRYHSTPAKTGFWGAVSGYLVALVLVLAALLVPPADWRGADGAGGDVRVLLIHWSLLLLPLAAGLAGFLKGRLTPE